MTKMPDEYWKKKLTPAQYQVLRNKATEPAFSGELVNNNGKGIYSCSACGAKLFNSDAKFESTESGLQGWPSFDQPENLANIELRVDNSISMKRTEVICKNCGSHLGHLFAAGDSKTGQHYCINSCALNFKEKSESKT